MPSQIDLRQMLGMKGEKYSRPAVELGMEIMGHGMSAQTARDTIRTFMARLYPDQVEDRDYRVPSVKMLKRWRRLLEPVCHFLALSAMDRGLLHFKITFVIFIVRLIDLYLLSPCP